MTSPVAVTPQTATTASKPYKPPKSAFRVARAFVRTAVLRTDLARSWQLTTQGVHQNMTEQQWLTGDIPIVPFPRSQFLVARYHIVRAAPTEVVLEVVMLPRTGSVVGPTLFYLHLVPDGKSWLVSYWAPAGEGGGLPNIAS